MLALRGLKTFEVETGPTWFRLRAMSRNCRKQSTNDSISPRSKSNSTGCWDACPRCIHKLCYFPSVIWCDSHNRPKVVAMAAIWGWYGSFAPHQASELEAQSVHAAAKQSILTPLTWPNDVRILGTTGNG